MQEIRTNGKYNLFISAVDDITVENFMEKLDNGVIVCKLAKLIEERCEATQQAFNGKLSAALEEVRKLYALFNSLMKFWPSGQVRHLRVRLQNRVKANMVYMLMALCLMPYISPLESSLEKS